MGSPGARKAGLLAGAAGAGAVVPDAISSGIQHHDARIYQQGASTGFEQGIEAGYQQGVQQGAEMGARQAAEQMLAAMQSGLGEAEGMGYDDGMYRTASVEHTAAPTAREIIAMLTNAAGRVPAEMMSGIPARAQIWKAERNLHGLKDQVGRMEAAQVADRAPTRFPFQSSRVHEAKLDEWASKQEDLARRIQLLKQQGPAYRREIQALEEHLQSIRTSPWTTDLSLPTGHRKAAAEGAAPGFAAGAKVPKPPAPPKPLPAGKMKMASVLAEVPNALAEALDLVPQREKVASVRIDASVEPLVKIAMGGRGGFSDRRLRSAAAAMASSIKAG